jgi:citrate lyase subunit beta/citryl-CoA lyase
MSGAGEHLRPRRSALYMPASNPRALDKARSLPCDVVILDLEDAVAPGAKAAARAQAAQALDAGGFGPRERVLRVNGLDTAWGEEDLAAAAGMALDAVLLPKVESPVAVHMAVQRLRAAGAPDGLGLWVMIETPPGVLEAPAICAAGAPLACAVLGTSDLARDLRLPPDPARTGLLSALSRCVLAARAAGIDVLDGVHLDLEDETGLAAACEQGRCLGFDGKTLIHPRQIETANRAFAPSTEAVEQARRIVAAWDEAEAVGLALAVVDGRLVEHLHAAEARRTLAMHRAIGERGAA